METKTQNCPGRLGMLAILLALTGSLLTTEAADKKRNELLQDDFPDQAACISAEFPKNNTALKGHALRLKHDANVLFDTDLLRLAAGWTGGYITTHGVAFDGAHGAHPKIDGEQKFG